MRLVFMGTPDFAVPSLRALLDAGYRPVAVVTVPDRPVGRGQHVRASAVKRVAEAAEVPVLQPESLKDEAFQAALAALDPDVIVVVAFRILPPEVYGLAKRGAFNLHASLLPAFRGAAPINRALMAGVSETGVTTFFLQPKVDTGEMILQRRVPVGPDETAGELHDRLAAVGAEAVVETVRRIERGEAVATPQDDALASPAPKLFKEDMAVDWAQPARRVHDHVRALSPYPAAWTTLPDGRQLKLLRTAVVEDEGQHGTPGEVTEAGERIVVACGEGAVEVLELQRQGKRRMDARDFLNGYPVAAGAKLGGDGGPRTPEA
ncbi:MAG: methionyl-tRNA formyltransferase [Rubricoccaceae bacterium]|nr:methionyl-tRNA formyltransferase [Rubricoccaceae bacterium]